MSRRALKDLAWLALSVAITRFLFRTREPYLLDSINFILGVNEFDPDRHQPHPPGYFLYIQSARLMQYVFDDPHSALVALSIAAGCAAVALVYLLADEWFGRDAAIFAGLIFLASPLCWFHGGVALVYIVEMFFSLLVGLLCWRSSHDRGSLALVSAIALGLAAGFRQSSIVFLGPLWLYSIRSAGPARIAAAFGLLLATLLAWMLPMASASGGALQYWNSLAELWNRVPGQELAVTGSLGVTALKVASQILAVAAVFVMAFASVAPLPLMRALPAGFDSPKRIFAAVWIVPALLFFSFGFLRLINAGYLLLILPPVLVVIGAQAAEWFQEAKAAPRGRQTAAACFLLFNLAAFLFAPAYFSYRNVRTAIRDNIAFQSALRSTLSPETTVIVAFDDHIHGARHAGYYLPEYLTLQLPETVLERGVRITAMRDRQTAYLESTAGLPAVQFAFFPPEPNLSEIPNATVAQESFRPGSLRTEKHGAYGVVVGSVEDLYVLFPEAARRPE